MVLAAGSELVEDVRRAPDDVLSTDPMTEVRRCAERGAHTHKNYPVYSTRVHARLIEQERQIPCRCDTFQVDAEYRGYVQGRTRRAHYGYE